MGVINLIGLKVSTEARSVFCKPTHPSVGSGTLQDPYRDFETAQMAAGIGGTIFMLSTVYLTPEKPLIMNKLNQTYSPWPGEENECEGNGRIVFHCCAGTASTGNTVPLTIAGPFSLTPTAEAIAAAPTGVEITTGEMI